MTDAAGHRGLRGVAAADVQVQKEGLLPGGLVIGEAGPQDGLAAVQAPGLVVQFPGEQQGLEIVVFQQRLRRDLQHLCQLAQNGHRGVGLPPLDLAQHAAGHARLRRQPLHAELLALADAFDILPHRPGQFHRCSVLSGKTAIILINSFLIVNV